MRNRTHVDRSRERPLVVLAEFNPRENSNLRVSTSIPAVGTFAHPRDCHFHFGPGSWSLHTRHTRNERLLNNFTRQHTRNRFRHKIDAFLRRSQHRLVLLEKRRPVVKSFGRQTPSSFDVIIRGAIKKLIRGDSACIVDIIFRVAHSSEARALRVTPSEKRALPLFKYRENTRSFGREIGTHARSHRRVLQECISRGTNATPCRRGDFRPDLRKY